MARRSVLRASDSDREQVAERLRHAAAEGRLMAAELEHRLAAALRARTYGELDPLVADLPGKRAPQRRSGLPTVGRAVTMTAITVAALAVVAIVAMVVAGLFMVWAVWAIVAWWVFGRRRPPRRRTHRPGVADVRLAHRRLNL